MRRCLILITYNNGGGVIEEVNLENNLSFVFKEIKERLVDKDKNIKEILFLKKLG